MNHWARVGLLGGALIVATTFSTGCASKAVRKSARVSRESYHGWPNAFHVRNATAEFVVVPQVGRVMSFRFRNGENVFWEDCSLDGKPGDPNGKEWVNFGGDKTWPSPEGNWGSVTGYKQWMPPPGFDGTPATAEEQGGTVVLTSSVDPFYGIRAVRRISLNGDLPELKIETTYERISGTPPLKVGVWVITQFKNPERVYVPLAGKSIFENGFYVFPGAAWPQLKKSGNAVIITRDPKEAHKMACDGSRLLWVGKDDMCLVTSDRDERGEYPDRGASAEVYTNPDPKTYVELEMLGPLSTMKPGEKIEQGNTYKLVRRRSGDPDSDARQLLAAP